MRPLSIGASQGNLCLVGKIAEVIDVLIDVGRRRKDFHKLSRAQLA